MKGIASGLRTHMEDLPHVIAATSPVVPAQAGIHEEYEVRGRWLLHDVGIRPDPYMRYTKPRLFLTREKGRGCYASALPCLDC